MKFQRAVLLPDDPTNGDENAYAKRIASYSKGFPHNDLGGVDGAAFSALLGATTSDKPNDFENIPMSEADQAKRRKLVNPQSAFAFDYARADSGHLEMPPPPAFGSAEQAGEMVGNYLVGAASCAMPGASRASGRLAHRALA